MGGPPSMFGVWYGRRHLATVRPYCFRFPRIREWRGLVSILGPQIGENWDFSRLKFLGITPTGFWCNLGRKLIIYKWYAKDAYFGQQRKMLWSATTSSIFRPQWPLPLALIAWSCGLPKIFSDLEYASIYCTVAYCRLGNVRREAVVAILPDNCHPSSVSLLCKWYAAS